MYIALHTLSSYHSSCLYVLQNAKKYTKIYTFNFFNTHPHHHKQNKPRGTRIITGCRVVSHIKSFSSHSNCKKTKSLKTRSNLARSAFTHLAVLTKGPLNNTNKKQDNSYNFQNILENNIPILNSFYSKNPKKSFLSLAPNFAQSDIKAQLLCLNSSFNKRKNLNHQNNRFDLKLQENLNKIIITCKLSVKKIYIVA